MNLLRSQPKFTDVPPPSSEVLIEEARQRQRKRRVMVMVAVLVAGVGVAVGFAVSGGTPRRVPTTTSRNTHAPAKPAQQPATVAYAVPSQPSSLAMATNGDLYVSDPGLQQILRRLPNGKFQVVAGTGVAGSTGNGGFASRAEINDPSSLAVASNGTLYFVQQGSTPEPSSFGPLDEVRAVAPDGKITTVIGAHPNCSARQATPNAIPAEDADFGGGALAIGANGNLYISTIICPNVLDAGPLMELTPKGQLITRPASPIIAKYQDCNGSVAFSSSGAVYASCNSGRGGGPNGHGKELLIVEPNGSTTQLPGVYPYDDESGLTTAPDGSVIAGDYLKVVRVSPQGVQTIIDLGATHSLGTITIGGRTLENSMEPNGIAVDRQGNIYLAATSGFGNGTFTGIIEVHTNGQVQILWHRSSAI